MTTCHPALDAGPEYIAGGPGSAAIALAGMTKEEGDIDA